MERAHYRRVTQSRLPGRTDTSEYTRRGPRPPEGEGDYRERLIMQCIVTGLILSVVLSTRLMDNSFTQYVKSNLRQALAGQTTAESVFEETKRLGQALLGDALPVAEETVTENPVTPVNTPPDENAGLYIDEEALTGLDTSKSPVPEPSASPEP